MTQIIDSFSRLPLGSWLDILKIQDDPALDDVDRQAETIAVLTGLTAREVLDLPIAEYTVLARKARFLGEVPEKLPRAASSYRLGDLMLKVQGDLMKITTAQYIDFKTFAPQREAALPQVLSVVLVPDGHKYNDGSYDIAKVQAAIRDGITVEQALSLFAFFLGKLTALIRSTRSYLHRLVRKERDPEKRAILEEKAAMLRTAVDYLTGAGDGSRT